MKLKVSLTGCIILIALTAVIPFLKNLQFPNDAEGTLKKVRNHTLRVGYTNAEPWIFPSANGPQGIEAKLAVDFAKSLDARVEWVEGTEEQLYRALKHNEIDLMVAGITDQTPWKNELGTTKPYIEANIVVGEPQEAPIVGSVEGQWVAVKNGTDEGFYVHKEKGRAFYTSQLPVANMFTAAYDWQIQHWKWKETGIVLETERHVIAVPPGENAFLLALDKYLFANKESIRQELNK